MRGAAEQSSGAISSRSGRAAGVILGVVMLVAAAGKLLSGAKFGVVVSYLLPAWGHSAEAVEIGTALVPAWEAFLGAALIIGSGRTVVVLCAVTLTSFSVALLVLASDERSPSCGCFGVLLGKSGRSDAMLGLVRNGALVALCIVAIAGAGKPHRNRVQCADTGDNPSGAGRGFTLVELLLTIMIIGVLLSVLVPTLADSRCAAVSLRRMSMHRQLVAALSLYGCDARDSFPFLGTPGDPEAPIRVRGFALTGHGYFGGQQWHWASVVMPDYFDAPRTEVEPPGMRSLLVDDYGWPEDVIRADYFITHNAFAAPEFWREWQVPAVPPASLYRAGRWSEILFPSAKGLLVDIRGGMWSGCPRSQAGVLSVGLADGSARHLDTRSLDPSLVSNPLELFSAYPVWTTRNGLRGRDY